MTVTKKMAGVQITLCLKVVSKRKSTSVEHTLCLVENLCPKVFFFHSFLHLISSMPVMHSGKMYLPPSFRYGQLHLVSASNPPFRSPKKTGAEFVPYGTMG